MAISLVIASCGPASVEEEEEEIVIGEEEEEEEVVEKEELLPPEVPKYGGTTNFYYREPMGFDPAYTLSIECMASLGGFCNNEMMEGDWTKGLAGTGETDWQRGYLDRIGLLTGSLSTGYELPDDETIIWHVRKGVHFWDKPPVNGRECTADDVAWSMDREFTAPKSFLTMFFKPEDRPKSVTALDKYTVEVKVPAANQGLLLLVTADQLHIYAPEVVEMYGDYKDWRNLNGTGPFILTDYVRGSSLTYERNPNYFQNDPLHPENQLPYLDVCKQLIIEDKSTQLAAIRTAKIDCSRNVNVTWEDYELLMKQAPDLKYYKGAGADNQIWARVDKPELPFYDLKVRQAMTLAIDQPGIIEEYYNGNADILGHPYPPYKSWAPLYTPLEEMPSEPTIEGSACSVQELYTHNPDKAKRLLSDAGYPSGFKTEIVCGTAEAADFLAIIKEQWADVGIDLEIKMLEYSVFRSVNRARTYDEIVYTGSPTAMFPSWMLHIRKESLDAKSYYDSPVTREAYNKVNKLVGKDDAQWMKIIKDVTPFTLEDCVGIWLPVPHSYTMWWPWLQNYNGENSLGYDNQMAFTWYAWIDQDMKKAMGH